MPILAPPPSVPVQSAFTDTSPRFNPFDLQAQSVTTVVEQEAVLPLGTL